MARQNTIILDIQLASLKVVAIGGPNSDGNGQKRACKNLSAKK